MPLDTSTEAAIALGTRQAQTILDSRQAALARRSEVIAAHPRRLAVNVQVLSAHAAPVDTTIHTVGYLVAGGDSWFDYPFHDVLKLLHDEHGYNIESAAHAGDSVEHIAYQGGQLDGIQRCFENVTARGVLPRAFLLSGGGDDLAGKEFGMLLNNATGPNPGWNDEILDGLIHQRLLVAYKVLIATINGLSAPHPGGKPLPILVHGYDYPVPDGRGVLGGFWFLPGPWLKPGFDEKLFHVLLDNASWMRKIIDAFNQMLQQLPRAFPNVVYVDLRNTLSGVLAHNAYQKSWANELHPTRDGFAAVATKFSRALDAL